jgi:V8-like Glu-specific endopeptidase
MDEDWKRREARRRHNEEFYRCLQARRPGARAQYDRMAAEVAAARGARALAEGAAPEGFAVPEMVLETIVRKERPVLFVQDDWLNKTDATLDGEEAKALVDELDRQHRKFQPLMPLIGRMDVANFPGIDFLGTAWFVAPDIVVTNRHVASLIARRDGRRFVFKRGVAGNPLTSSVCTAHEFDDLAPDKARVFAVREVLYIEPESSPIDIAFLRVQRRTDGSRQDFIPVAREDVGADNPVFVVGYPARAPKSVIPDQERMKELFRDRYDVKRAAPGFTMPGENGSTRHDCTTLGGNSGSVVLDLKTGLAVGLHFAGLYQESNYAVRASVLRDYIEKRKWQNPPLVEIGPAAPATSTVSVATPPLVQTPAGNPVLSVNDRSATILVPLSITVSVGTPTVVDAGRAQVSGAAGPAGPALASRVSLAAADAAAKDFWDQRPEGVIAVRVGFLDSGDEIGDVPCITASVPADRLAGVQATGPARFQSLQVRYLPADAAEQIDAWPGLESVDAIEYDDDARTGEAFSFDPLNEAMTVRTHVGPEYSWDELKAFLAGARESLVSAIYEFHGSHIADAIEDRLAAGASLELVMDNATFSKVKDPDEEFDRVARFESWERFGDRFERIVAPEGTAGLISDSYHIKVTVREDDQLWLSSGNWKMGSSQPIVTQEQRDNAADTDLPGNREWHVIIRNKTLADRFRNHIRQDFDRSRELGGAALPRSLEAAEIFVDVPVEEGVILERRAPGRVLEPRTFNKRIKVKPLLTPDKEGAVYSDAVLALIGSARKSLLFQIPYIAMPSNPRADRGYIDALIKALTRKLKTLDDARLILRTGGQKFSQPAHAAWFFKSKGVDIGSRVRQMENHHTKGMIVDGKRVLIGSHNWSKPGVTLNRDASLIFDDSEIAGYYAEAFEIDWARANPIKAKRFVIPEAVMLEAVGDEPPAGYRRVRLSDLLKEDD